MRSTTLAAMLLLALAGCSDPPCTDRIVRTIRSPDGTHDAVLFARDCGATVGFSTHVSVDPAPHETGNVFVADGRDGGRLGAWGGPWADIEWTGAGRLVISHDRRARVFKQGNELNGVHVEYRETQ